MDARPSEVEALSRALAPEGGDWLRDVLATLAERDRQLEALRAHVRELERRAGVLEAENSQLRGNVRDLQSVLRALGAAMGESVNVLTMPGTPND